MRGYEVGWGIGHEGGGARGGMGRTLQVTAACLYVYKMARAV